jgi:hypothetical protein
MVTGKLPETAGIQLTNPAEPMTIPTGATVSA